MILTSACPSEHNASSTLCSSIYSTHGPVWFSVASWFSSDSNSSIRFKCFGNEVWSTDTGKSTKQNTNAICSLQYNEQKSNSTYSIFYWKDNISVIVKSKKTMKVYSNKTKLNINRVVWLANTSNLIFIYSCSNTADAIINFHHCWSSVIVTIRVNKF